MMDKTPLLNHTIQGLVPRCEKPSHTAESGTTVAQYTVIDSYSTTSIVTNSQNYQTGSALYLLLTLLKCCPKPSQLQDFELVVNQQVGVIPEAGPRFSELLRPLVGITLGAKPAPCHVLYYANAPNEARGF